MKKGKKLRRATVLLLVLALLMVNINTGMNESTETPGTMYSDWLDLNSLLRNGSGETSSDLADFLDSIVIEGAEINSEGKYVILEGVPYTVQMHFSEKTSEIQFAEGPDGCTLTYHFPDGFEPFATSGTIELTGDGGAVRLNYVISEDTLTVTADPESPGYSNFLLSEDVQFEIHATGLLSQETIQFSSEVSGEFDIDTKREVTVRKIGEYDGSTNRIKYTIQATSVGNNTDIHIGDTITGTALTYDPASLTLSSNLRDTVPYEADTRTGETFGLNIPSMAHGETVTIEYYADVNLSGLTGTGNGRYGTVEETANAVRITSHEDPPGHEIKISEDDFYNHIVLSSNSKTASSQTVRDDKTYVTWTIVLNEDANISIAGSTITDVIDASCQSFMRYAGSGIHIEKYEKGSNTPAAASDIRWGTNGLSASGGGSTWTYTIPDADADHAYRYVITYETEVDSDKFLITTVVGNTVENEYDTDHTAINVETTGDEVEAVKSSVSSTVDTTNKEAETEWEITFTVPATGLDSAVVIDSLPGFLNYAENIWYWDTYKENSVRVGAGDLVEGERYSVASSPQDHQVVITFTKNNGEPGLTGTGLPRTIHVYLTTEASHEWLVYAESESRARTHVNNAIVRVNGQDINVTGTVNYNTTAYDLEKIFDGTYSTKDDLPIYVYKIILKGVNDDAFDEEGYLTITDVYNPDYLGNP